MNKEILRLWLSVVLSAVILGLAVTYLMQTWMPADTLHWVIWGVVALIAVRSVFRIATLAAEAGKVKKSDNKE